MNDILKEFEESENPFHILMNTTRILTDDEFEIALSYKRKKHASKSDMYISGK